MIVMTFRVLIIGTTILRFSMDDTLRFQLAWHINVGNIHEFQYIPHKTQAAHRQTQTKGIAYDYWCGNACFRHITML